MPGMMTVRTGLKVTGAASWWEEENGDKWEVADCELHSGWEEQGSSSTEYFRRGLINGASIDAGWGCSLWIRRLLTLTALCL